MSIALRSRKAGLPAASPSGRYPHSRPADIFIHESLHLEITNLGDSFAFIILFRQVGRRPPNMWFRGAAALSPFPSAWREEGGD